MKIEMTKGGSRRHPNQPCYRTAASHSLDLYFISKVMCSKYVKIIHVFKLHVFSDVQCFGDPELFMKAKHAEHPHDLLCQNMTKKPHPERRSPWRLPIAVAAVAAVAVFCVSAVFSPALLGVRRIAARATLCATPPG